MKFPVLILNFKAYAEAAGRRAVEIAKAAERVAKELGVNIAVAPNHLELALVAQSVEIPVYAQGVDVESPGAHTAHVALGNLKEAGAAGVILNHSEAPLRLNELARYVGKARELGLDVVVCAPDPTTSLAAAALGPHAVAVEPPELIGTGRAVSRYKPETVVQTVQLVAKHFADVAVITGAGIESGEDVEAALRLGTRGVLLASAAVKAKDHYQKIMELAKPLLK
ncbi:MULTISPECIES: triose-phosphate isomerase [Pyrobaculum]|uniref:Triosephosphate isomerase n=2 Tax=Pyrobaculum arsenaticum TaxID=121277 RepID=TPIS_PYRAR|nr:triose-phosphate isomerase [Pyrobaculum arsenaticum]A4WIJ6.1 RecName: Full=Triosephosphate isomerase; Short=TIM; Short=TPI; AltName: Full=Triose-phosphate isomerase [Pyrobaculum arsenaticum DSM 13514]ABP50213.1 triosephosphate isomerase [Pyrobaculum arsenaticum DSM 13514]MCY0889892.1 triose-phosphate isomerase [Pyrobaculum arsenaticum]NYR14850.1 triose-phosphate isomerase [Pyrobaculum arsenaticum]